MLHTTCHNISKLRRKVGAVCSSFLTGLTALIASHSTTPDRSAAPNMLDAPSLGRSSLAEIPASVARESGSVPRETDGRTHTCTAGNQRRARASERERERQTDRERPRASSSHFRALCCSLCAIRRRCCSRVTSTTARWGCCWVCWSAHRCHSSSSDSSDSLSTCSTI